MISFISAYKKNCILLKKKKAVIVVNISFCSFLLNFIYFYLSSYYKIMLEM